MNLVTDRQRLDKWLWAARFFKSRSLAHQAITDNRIKVNNEATKPSKEIRVGDLIEIRMSDVYWQIKVVGLNEQRRPANEASQLYCETQDSHLKREQQQLLRKIAPTPGSNLHGRPTKRDRRKIERFNKQE